MTRAFDAIVIGAGQAGPPLAARLSAAGMSVALIERHLFGGTCVNTGCMPTKAMVASAYAAHLARRGAEFGVTLGGGQVAVDLAAVHARAAKISSAARVGIEHMLDGLENVNVFRGHATFKSKTEVWVGDERFSAPRIFLNVGGRAAVPALGGLAEVDYLNNTSILALEQLPRHLVVVGGSYIGLEFAQMFRRFGSQVTIVEMKPQLIGREDSVVSEAIRDILAAEGIAIRTGATCIRLARHEAGVAVGVDCETGAPEVIGSHVLLATGRRPNTDDLGLEAAGVAVDERGYIKTDDTLSTNVPGIWALGDCNGRAAFTHTAYNDFEIVAANLLDGEARRVSDRVPAYALYIDPPLGRVGMTEAQARAGGRPILVAERPMNRVGRAIEKGETLGMMRLIADAQSRRILGAAILGVGGDEAIHGIVDLMNVGATVDQLQRAVPIHPTVSELLPTLASSLSEKR